MPDILHRIGAAGVTTDDAYRALTTLDGLTSWWTRDTTGDTDLNGVIAFRFPQGGFDMRVVELVPGKRVAWHVIDGPAEWVGTDIRFELQQADGYTIILFEHRNWREQVEFMYHCSTKWASFLLSLKQLLETGAGAPSPDDIPISDWH